MRNPSAYVPNFFNSQICYILSKFKNFIFAKIFDFKFSHRRESTRRGGVANFTGAAAFGGGVHPCNAMACILPQIFKFVIKTENLKIRVTKRGQKDGIVSL